MEREFLEESELIEKMQSEHKSWLWYIEYHSPELIAEYEEYCKNEGYKVFTEENAEAFISYREVQFEASMSNDIE